MALVMGAQDFLEFYKETFWDTQRFSNVML